MRRDMNEEKFDKIKNFVEGYKEVYKDKTQNDLIDEVKKIRSNMSDEEFKKQIRTMDKIRGFLSEKQQEKLDRLIKMLEGK